MALLNRFSKLNDRGETGIFTFIVTKSVTRDFHRDATTKDFCFGYHRWAVSFQRPSEQVLGVHLLLRNASPNTSCQVDFSLTLLNREHFSLNQVYTKRQAKFTITNPMQGVSRWIHLAELHERRFSNETGEFLFELSLSNMSTIFECDIQLQQATIGQYKAMLAADRHAGNEQPPPQLINLETNCFTFGAFDWSLTIVPLVVRPADSAKQQAASAAGKRPAKPEPVCRVYLNRLNGFESLCRVRYRVILGHHNQPGGAASYVDSKLLDQMSDCGGRIRGHQYKRTNVLKLCSARQSHDVRSSSSAAGRLSPPAQPTPQPQAQQASGGGGARHSKQAAVAAAAAQHGASASGRHQLQAGAQLDLRVHIEMFCANIVSEAKVPIRRKPNEPQLANCSDRSKQAWCVECDADEGPVARLKLFFLDLQSVPRNHIRYISWIAYVVRRDPKSGHLRDSVPVENAPHSNYYLQDGMDLGTIMDTSVRVDELNAQPASYLDGANLLTVHIEWVDSLLLFSHLYNNYDSLATIQRHQISRELGAIQHELEHLERKHAQVSRTLNQLLGASRGGTPDDAKRAESICGPSEEFAPARATLAAAGDTQVAAPPKDSERLKFAGSPPPQPFFHNALQYQPSSSSSASSSAATATVAAPTSARPHSSAKRRLPAQPNAPPLAHKPQVEARSAALLAPLGAFGSARHLSDRRGSWQRQASWNATVSAGGGGAAVAGAKGGGATLSSSSSSLLCRDFNSLRATTIDVAGSGGCSRDDEADKRHQPHEADQQQRQLEELFHSFGGACDGAASDVLARSAQVTFKLADGGGAPALPPSNSDTDTDDHVPVDAAAGESGGPISALARDLQMRHSAAASPTNLRGGGCVATNSPVPRQHHFQGRRGHTRLAPPADDAPMFAPSALATASALATPTTQLAAAADWAPLATESSAADLAAADHFGARAADDLARLGPVTSQTARSAAAVASFAHNHLHKPLGAKLPVHPLNRHHFAGPQAAGDLLPLELLQVDAAPLAQQHLFRQPRHLRLDQQPELEVGGGVAEPVGGQFESRLAKEGCAPLLRASQQESCLLGQFNRMSIERTTDERHLQTSFVASFERHQQFNEQCPIGRDPDEMLDGSQQFASNRFLASYENFGV